MQLHGRGSEQEQIMRVNLISSLTSINSIQSYLNQVNDTVTANKNVNRKNYNIFVLFIHSFYTHLQNNFGRKRRLCGHAENVAEACL